MPTGGELLAAIPGVVLLVVIWVAITRSQRRALAEMDAVFAGLGFRPIENTARSYLGVHRGHEAGFTQGAGTTIGVEVEVGTSELSSKARRGTEFWVALGFNGPAFMVVERNETRSASLASFCSMAKALPTGDAAFDARFQVFCEEPSWSSAVLDPALRQQILAFPYVLLLQAKERCFFSPCCLGGQGTIPAHAGAAPGRRRRWLEVLADDAATFLDLPLAVVQRMKAIRRT